MVTKSDNRNVPPTARPQGRDAVTTALKQAALELLAEQGISFSTREVAARANVNHGLVHRHFGTKHQLLSAAVADRNLAVQQELLNDASLLDLSLQGNPPTAILLARLILDDATALIGDHLATTTGVSRAADRTGVDDQLSANERVAIANAISLGWAVFGTYALQAAGVAASGEATSMLRTVIDDLLGHDEQVNSD